MKKLIGIFAIILLGVSVFGQFNLGDGSANVSGQSVIEGLTRIENGKMSTISLNANVYHFYENDKLYVVSHDTSTAYKSIYRPKNGIKERDIYLYRLDEDGWKIASDLVKTDFWNTDSGDWEVITSNFIINKERKCDLNDLVGEELGYSEVNKLPDGSVKMKVMFFYGIENPPDGGKSVRWQYRWDTITFSPNGDETYKVKNSNFYGSDSRKAVVQIEATEKRGVKINSSDNPIGYESFNDDNISLSEVEDSRGKFIDGIGQKQYSRYLNHEYKMNFNAPCADRSRNFSPKDIENGYQRLYFANSENVYLQRRMQNSRVTEIIYFHPDGRIYTIHEIVNDKPEGRVKFVDLENWVILEGAYRNGKLVGKWNTPLMANFNVQDNRLINQYPGVVNQMLTFTNFYYYDKGGRVSRMSGYAQ